jgi:hypothetical protein
MLPTCHTFLEVQMKAASVLRFVIATVVVGICLHCSTQPMASQKLNSGSARATFAKNFQSQLAEKGIAVQASLHDGDKPTMRVQSAGLTPRVIYGFVSSPEFSQSAKSAGIGSIVFSNGTRGRWDYDPQRESMLWQPALY